MTKHLFSKQQQAQLKLNPYVKTVSANAITYTDEFKEFFLDQYDKGKYLS